MKKYNQPLDLVAYAMASARAGQHGKALKALAAACVHPDAEAAIGIINASNAQAQAAIKAAARKSGAKVNASRKSGAQTQVANRLRASFKLNANDVDLGNDDEEDDLDLGSGEDDDDDQGDDSDIDLDADVDEEVEIEDDDLDDDELDALLDGDQQIDADVDEEEGDATALFASFMNAMNGQQRKRSTRR